MTPAAIGSATASAMQTGVKGTRVAVLVMGATKPWTVAAATRAKAVANFHEEDTILLQIFPMLVAVYGVPLIFGEVNRRKSDLHIFI